MWAADLGSAGLGSADLRSAGLGSAGLGSAGPHSPENIWKNISFLDFQSLFEIININNN